MFIPQRQSKNRQLAHRHGFTLIEVVMALALITFLIGGVFGIADSALRLGSSMSQSRIEEARIMHFTAQLRVFWETLSPQARMETDGSNILRIATEYPPFVWNRRAWMAEAVEFERKNNALIVRHLRHPNSQPQGWETISELNLLDDLQSFNWDFYLAQEDQWVGELRENAAKPLFVRLRYQFRNLPQPSEDTFWVANDLVLSGANPPPPLPPPPGSQASPNQFPNPSLGGNPNAPTR
jgi:prepilin-type N-terminal cleavage/methylation domain-containing protein